MGEIIRIDNYEFDERFYQKRSGENGEIVTYQPSVTYKIGAVYPNGYALSEWRGDVGNKRADEILTESSEDGSFVHEAIEGFLNDRQVTAEYIRSKFSPKRSLKIMRCLKSFLDWYDEYKPKTIKTESVVWSDEHGFAGTLDYLCEIDGKVWIIDWKTSKSIRPSHKVQVCAYALAEPCDHIGILQLGNTTKSRYSFITLGDEEREKYTNEWHVVDKMFRTIHPNARPNQETFPDIFKLGKAA